MLNAFAVLSKGLHEISSNLDYRINYTDNNELKPVCDDFDSMAQRFSELSRARHQDDENRRELIASLSHDLRTPLTAIKAYVEGLETGVAATPESQLRYLKIIKQKTEDIEHFVSQMFLYSKLNISTYPMHMEMTDIGFDLTSLVENIYDEYRQKGLDIAITKNVAGIRINADRSQLRHMFINIFDNSVKYGNRENGTMRISCRVEDLSVIISLTDNGGGVSEANLDKIFNPFYRTDSARSNPGEGSGMGLSISTKIMQHHGGSIRAENVPGGFSVIITLPLEHGGPENEKNSHN
ncbi:HAMP domain-containing histidine kinase [Brucepastera parasyntrophica]|uniref:sensor histidine kinase n=1 Tax=Brucepastera parasyntrophica TaxID=2880008 RepID=UPI0021090C22|nr:HAMP domain-containing sensor histidine kinase [Brucepastera parasyntrophica]ULQ58907.1 HAMP domain-containing histidine kinase [Brucepastera parasyntrophica]